MEHAGNRCHGVVALRSGAVSLASDRRPVGRPGLDQPAGARNRRRARWRGAAGVSSLGRRIRPHDRTAMDPRRLTCENAARAAVGLLVLGLPLVVFGTRLFPPALTPP